MNNLQSFNEFLSEGELNENFGSAASKLVNYIEAMRSILAKQGMGSMTAKKGSREGQIVITFEDQVTTLNIIGHGSF